MSQDLIQIARGIVSTYSSSDWNALRALIGPNGTYNEIGSQRKMQGPDAIINAMKGWKAAMSDSGGNVTNAFASGNMVALEVQWHGTQDGPFPLPTGTFPPSGRKQQSQAVMIVKFQGDKIVEINHYFDMLSFLQQIGAIPVGAAQ